MTAAVLADKWPELQRDGFSADSFHGHVAAPFVVAVSEHNMRNRGLARWALAHAALHRRGPGATIGMSIASRLLGAHKMVDLPRGLQVVLTSTDLVSGRAFRVSQEFIGGWQFGYAPTPASLSTATALAASTAVPFLFPPVPLRTRSLGLRDGTPSELALVDGGVYDNLGLEWFQGWDRGRPAAAREADRILVVDASSPLRLSDRRYSWVRSLRRSQEAQYAQTRASRVRWFVEQLIDGKMQGVYLPIGGDPSAFRPPLGTDALVDAADGALPAGFASALSSLRTDLDRFSAEEAALLMYHGYWATHVRLVHLWPAMAVSQPQWRDYAHLSTGRQAQLLDLLAWGARRRLHRAS